MIAVAIVAPWSAVWGVDNRTYAEMISGVRHTGVPSTSNVQIENFREARAPFNVYSRGKLWGAYPPFFAYFAAPADALGGIRFVQKLNVLLVGVLALSVFALVRRVVRAPVVATAASYAVVLSSPIPVVGFETLAQPLVIVLSTLACLAAVACVEVRTPKTFGFALLSGGLGGLAVATHLIALPMMAMLTLGLAVVPANAFDASPMPQDLAPARFRLDGVPDRIALLRAACSATALALAMVPVSLLNHVRFGTWNPISYGPCPWDHCKAIDAGALSAGGLLGFALPALPWVLGVGVGLYLGRRSRWALLAVALVAGAVLIPETSMRDRVIGALRAMYGYGVDVSQMDFRMAKVPFPWFAVPPDGLGNLHCGGGDVAHGTAIKSMLQCTPVLAIGLAAPLARTGPGARLLLVFLPVCGLFGYFALFSRFEGASTFGWPYLYLRYTAPAVPLLLVLASSATTTLPWRPWHAVVTAAIAIVGVVYFTRSLDDGPFLRRFLELRGTLALAGLAVTFTLTARRFKREGWRRLACIATAACLGAGIAVSVGVDGFISVTQSNGLERRLRRFAQVTPNEFGLIGWGTDTDSLLALRGERDIQYVDLTESRGDWANVRDVIDIWSNDKRPIYGVFPAGKRFRWPYADWDVPAELINADDGFWRIGPARVKAPPRSVVAP